MESIKSPPAQRPGHKRNASSKSNLLRSLVSSKTRPVVTPDEVHIDPVSRTKSVPLLPPDHPHVAKSSRVLGERQGNVQSPPTSPSKSRRAPAAKSNKDATTKVPTKSQDGVSAAKKSKSSTNLSGMFARMNRSSKDLSATVQKDKENTTPPSTSGGVAHTPIWAQFASASSAKPASRPSTRDSKSSDNFIDEIARYTPQNYSPSKQRNFNGTLDQPSMRPTLNSRPRPQSAYFAASEGLAAIGRRVSGQRASIEGRNSEDTGRRLSRDSGRRVSGERPPMARRATTGRKVIGSSTEQAATKDKLNVAKRGNRVMAAVAAFQSRGRSEVPVKQEVLDEKSVDEAFEAVLDSRQIPEPMRQKMRSLTMRVKADFIKQNQGSTTLTSSPGETVPASNSDALAALTSTKRAGDAQEPATTKDTKRSRSRPRSRAFTFSKGDKRGDASPTKDKTGTKSRPTSIHIPKDGLVTSPNTPTSPFGSLGRRAAAQAIPGDYIKYLQTHPDPIKTEVGRLHKLRILLRNETVAWVDSFLALGGMTEIVGLLQRIMAIEWREEHEDQLLHETLLCLKGLCTTEKAMAELEKVADELFPALLGMLFDEEKKGPAEYATRTVIVGLLFNFLASATNTPPAALEQRAQRVLTYLSEPKKMDDERPVDFVLDMHRPRPYRLWSKELSNVTKEVFWIFLHQLNVIPLPKPGSSSSMESTTDSAFDGDRAKVLEATYTTRHFPGSRPPVPAAPYIGGVEWDATTYLTSHLDLLNGLLASLPSQTARNSLRSELKASGFEKVMGLTLRTCKEKFYSGVHDALRAWVAASVEDGWETRFVREGPSDEERHERARSVSPKKSPKKEQAPRLDEVKVEALPKLDLSLGFGVRDEVKGRDAGDEDDGLGWIE
ncbi:hypothetical protein LTR86_008231 [Recurvomyces mirabilis]|nr:hypothetical protein LTR86_008231 [Recurvomyces mirabilis]